MIRHTLMFRFADEVPEGTRRSILAELETFPERYPAMRHWSMGENLSSRDQTYTHAMSVEFPDEQELLAYLTSESHETFVREKWRPVIADQAIVAYEFAGPEATREGRDA